jgi:hypothetical protein
MLRGWGRILAVLAALGLSLALGACDPPASDRLAKSCAKRSGAWRYGVAKANVVLLAFNRDPLGRPDSAPAERAEGPPCLACAKQMLDRGLQAVEFPIVDAPAMDRVGRVSLQRDGDGGCDAFRQDNETIMSAKYYDLRPPAGTCIGLQESVPRSARYAVASFTRTSDRARVVELVDLESRAVLARVVDFEEIPGGDAAPIPRTCRNTPTGAPAEDPTAFVLSSIQAPAKPSR